MSMIPGCCNVSKSVSKSVSNARASPFPGEDNAAMSHLVETTQPDDVERAVREEPGMPAPALALVPRRAARTSRGCVLYHLERMKQPKKC
jgi:hypothetical protein